MSPTVINFIRTSLLSLAAGVVLGVLIALQVLGPERPQFLTSAHTHVTLLGAVMMLIFGVGYHILPRFSGRPLYSERIATVQFWVNLTGLVGMVAVFIAAAYTQSDMLRYGVAPFGILYATGAVLFVFNILKTLSGALPAPVPLRPAGKPGPPAAQAKPSSKKS